MTAASEAAGAGVDGGRMPLASSRRVERTLLTLLVILALFRVAYHLAYVDGSPFALVPVADARALEQGAHDVARHLPLGSAPLQLSSLYAFVMAPALVGPRWGALLVLFQLVLAVAGLVAFHRTVRRLLGFRAAALSTLTLMAYPALAFHENKYGAAELTVLCAVGVLWAFERATARPCRLGDARLGAFAGLWVLATPAALLALPLVLVAAGRAARDAGRRAAPAVGVVLLGVALVLGALATRNLLVVGSPEVFGRHAITLPLFIGNNPQADGRYNDGGGVIDRSKPGGTQALQAGLQLDGVPPDELAAAIDDTLLQRATSFIASHPQQALELLGLKLAHLLGNEEPHAHYDMRGEAELIGSAYRLGLPFGLLAALGVLGMSLLVGGSLPLRAVEAARSPRAMAWLLGALLAAPVASMAVGYVSSGQRVPLAVPLALLSGPAWLALLRLGAAASAARVPRPGAVALALGVFVLLQASIPRGNGRQPDAWHYYYLGEINERVGSMPDAVHDYARAIQRDPNEPLFLMRQTNMLVWLLQIEAADAVLARYEGLERTPHGLDVEAHDARQRIDRIKRRWIADGHWGQRAFPAPAPAVHDGSAGSHPDQRVGPR